MGEATKHDKGKVRLDLIHPSFIYGLGTILTIGADLYGTNNWMNGMKWTRVFAALLRHLFAWMGGAGPTSNSFLFGQLDPDTDYSHLWHASACLFFLVCYEDLKLGTDDRWVIEEKEDNNVA